MNTVLFKVAFSAKAIFVPAAEADTAPCAATPAATAFTAALVKTGYTVDEKLFHTLCHLSPERLAEINAETENFLGLHLNWMPMIKNWKTPTGTDFYDSLIAMFANSLPPLQDMPGTTLPCGHFIPEGTFPIERYNGCPLCGKSFATSDRVFTGQGTKIKVLTLWTEDELYTYERSLLESKIPLEGTQAAALSALLKEFGLPDGIDIKIRENAAMAFLALIADGKKEQAASLVNTPADLLRFLWFEKSSSARIVRPKTIIDRAVATVGYPWQDDFEERKKLKTEETKIALKLKYNREICRFAATILEKMPMSAEKMCENMNPARGMWVRLIRALRLTEYSRKANFPKLREILDRFYRSDYDVWAGDVESSILSKDTPRALSLLSERPGTFARRLFSAMLHLGSKPVLEAFAKITDKTDLPLILSLGMYAAYCLDPDTKRSIRLSGGNSHIIPANKHLLEKTPHEITDMIADVKNMCTDVVRTILASRGRIGGTVYIAKELFNIPLPIGERAQGDAGNDYLPQGSRFAVEGDNIRLFLHWGEGLPAQHLDMDLSAIILYPERKEECAYYNLNPVGAIHSGDIQQIPDKVGAAEYIELSIPVLKKAGARYVAFTASAYTDGGVDPTVKVGWMDSKFPMKVDDRTGVAYDPSTVQFSTRLNAQSVFDSVAFGVLDIEKREVVWLELALDGQYARTIDTQAITVLLKKLDKRMSIGEFLALRAEVGGQTRLDDPNDADETFTTSSTDISRAAGLL